jgi:hypothetical protein
MLEHDHLSADLESVGWNPNMVRQEPSPIYLVYAPGTQVSLGNIEAVVNQVCISSGPRIEYEVVWWNGPTRTLAWVEAHEITSSESPSLRIGFI